MASISLQRVSRAFAGMDHPAVDRIDLEIADGELFVLLGPAGCGKSMLLRLIAGVERPDRGLVQLDGVDVTSMPTEQRGVAMVYQSYALYPHMTVAENLGHHLKVDRVPRAEAMERVAEIAELLGLADVLEEKPAKLSAGQRQRVAMGRGIVRRPRVLLMDEPLGNLEPRLRPPAQELLVQLHDQLGLTTVLATRDAASAEAVGDRIATLERGALVGCATPERVGVRRSG